MFKLFRLLKPYRLRIGLTFTLIFAQTLGQLYLPTLMAEIVNRGILQGDTGRIIRIGGIMLVVTAVASVCAIWAGLLSAQIGMGFGKLVRHRLFEQVEGFSLEEIHRFGAPSLITRTTNDITQLQTMLIVALRMVASAPLMAVGGMFMAISKNSRLALVIGGALPLLAGVAVWIAVKGVPLFKQQQVKLDKVNQVFRDGLAGVRVIRAFNRAGYEARRFGQANRELTETAIQVNQRMAALMPVILLLMNLTTLAVIWLGGFQVAAGRLPIGDLMAFIQYIMQIMFASLMAAMMLVLVPRAQASAGRIQDVLDQGAQLRDGPHRQTPAGQWGRLELEGVVFKYPGAKHPVLQDISFVSGPGEITAIIGGTGSGKTTLIHLILRFYDVTAGAIRVDGVDIRDLTQTALRAKIGFAPQQALLFSGSIAENIRFGRQDATMTEVVRAAEIAQAMEFISKLPQGMETPIAQGGVNVSGGQRQRLAIARALLRPAEIYLFDDSFSALDFKTDARLRAALKQATARATVVIVAQRVSTVMDADRIVVLDEGRLAGVGRHQELLASCPVYQDLVASQLS